MPSQEEYLDKLLKDLTNNIDDVSESNVESEAVLELTDAIESEPAIEPELSLEQEQVPDADMLREMLSNLDTEVESEALEELSEAPRVDDITMLSEEDIEKLLAAGSFEETKPTAFTEEADLMDMLQGMEEENLQDIHTLLKKSDDNEAVDDTITDLLQDDDAIGFLLASTDPMEDDAQLKKRLAKEKKQQLKEEKRLKKELKRLEKQAAKEAAKAKKKNKTVEVQNGGSDTLEDAELMSILSGETGDSSILETENDLFTGFETVDLDEEDITGPEQELLQAFDVPNDVFGSDNFELSTLEEVPHEEIADAEIEKLKKKEKKKGGFLSKVFEFLTEADDEEAEAIILSQENEKILQEMDSEEGKIKKGKKKGKKNKDAGNDRAEAEDDEAKGKKNKKEKKPKKTKAPRISVVEEPGKKLSKKRVSLILLICLTFALIMILIGSIMGEYSTKKEAVYAYNNGDFQTCYQNLYGKTLNESEQLMYNKSESILRMRVWLREYEIFAEEGSETEALDSLIQTVDDYPALHAFASDWNAASEVAILYQQVLQILADKYHLTENQAKEIAATPDDVTYTKKILALIAGAAYGSWDEIKTPVVQEIPDNQETQQSVSGFPDMLPEEEELTGTGFIDNIQ